MQVSILVLMDLSLQQKEAKIKLFTINFVSILVLMDLSLQQSGNREYNNNYSVSILVLMDLSLQPINTALVIV